MIKDLMAARRFFQVEPVFSRFYGSLDAEPILIDLPHQERNILDLLRHDFRVSLSCCSLDMMYAPLVLSFLRADLVTLASADVFDSSAPVNQK